MVAIFYSNFSKESVNYKTELTFAEKALINVSGAFRSLIGNPVEIGEGPAAVIGDEIYVYHCSGQKNGKVQKVG